MMYKIGHLHPVIGYNYVMHVLKEKIDQGFVFLFTLFCNGHFIHKCLQQENVKCSN